MKNTFIAIALALAVSTLNTLAQDAGGPPPGGGGAGHGKGGQQQRPSPEQLAAKLMEKFDANKDGKLSQDELTQALKDLREHKPPGGGSGGGNQSGKHRSQQSADQGGSGGEHKAQLSSDKAATQMIEKFSSDKTGLTKDELAKALAAHHANHGQHGGKGGPGGAASGKPPGDGANQ